MSALPTMLDAALSYAKRGWHVFPCIGKKPLTAHGFKDATVDESEIRDFWSDNPSSNIGIATGASNLLVIDCDPRHRGDTSLNELYIRHGDELFKRAPFVNSGGADRGRHYYFSRPEDLDVRNSAGTVAAGIDVRANGGYVMAPPSIHNATGQPYTWNAGDEDKPTPPIPSWLVPYLLKRPKKSAAPKRGVGQHSDRILEGTRNVRLTSLAGEMRRRGASADEMYLQLRVINESRCDPPLPDDEVRQVAESVGRYPGGTVTSPENLPTIVATDQKLSRISPEVVAALVKANSPVRRYFLRANTLVRVSFDDTLPIIEDMTKDRLRYEAARAANWIKLDRNDQEVDAYPPATVMSDVLATPRLPFDELLGVVDVPLFTSNGVLHDEPGYNNETLCIYAPNNLVVPPTNLSPSAIEIESAIAVLRDVLIDFPFASPADLANAIAYMLLPFARPFIDGPTPLHLFDAPTPGTGKTLLAQVCAIPACGDSVPIISANGRDDAEWRKSITAALINSSRVIIVDNVRGTLDSSPLAAVLTTRNWVDRILGKSETVSVRNLATWAATGNNITMSTEMTRRTVRIHLDRKSERPWDDKIDFVHPNLEAWVRANRSELVSAILVIIAGWVTAGMPLGKLNMGKFESWSRTMHGILSYAGVPDFLGNIEQLYSDVDSDGDEWRAFCECWFANFGEKPVGASRLISAAEQCDIPLGDGLERSKQTRLGKLLHSIRDRHFGNYRVEQAGREAGAARWRVITLSPDNQRHTGLF